MLFFPNYTISLLIINACNVYYNDLFYILIALSLIVKKINVLMNYYISYFLEIMNVLIPL